MQRILIVSRVLKTPHALYPMTGSHPMPEGRETMANLLIRLSQVRVLSGVPYFDEVPERLKGADCKSVIRRFESGPHLHKNPAAAAVSLTREIELRQGFVTYKSTPALPRKKNGPP